MYIIGIFGWEIIGIVNIPFIIRLIDGLNSKFVPVRIAEKFILNKYLHYLRKDMYAFVPVKYFVITEAEANMLNKINREHYKQAFGNELFLAGQDRIINLEYVMELYSFLEVCYTKLLSNDELIHRDKCGFIRINSELVLPYCVKDYQKYVPLFYFKGKTQYLKKYTGIKLVKWSLTYLKFCCKVQCIKTNFYTSDSCIVVPLNEIKNLINK